MDEKNQDSIGYAFKGKIMISSIAILFSACFVIVTFHVCTRWCGRRRHSDRNTRRVTPPPTTAAVSQGLDLSAVNSLPTFVYASEDGAPPPPECAVCLSEFEGGETGRILPECKHCFHVDCIDAWLHSHRHCPLCRVRVVGRVPDSTVVPIHALELGSGSGSIPSDETSSPSSSAEDAAKAEEGPDPEAGLGQDQGFRVSRFWL